MASHLPHRKCQVSLDNLLPFCSSLTHSTAPFPGPSHGTHVLCTEPVHLFFLLLFSSLRLTSQYQKVFLMTLHCEHCPWDPLSPVSYFLCGTITPLPPPIHEVVCMGLFSIII